MKTAVATKLEAARVCLEELARLTSELAAAHPAVFENPVLHNCLIAFEKAHAEAHKRLERPTLSIATIGTTSSGKSTIVNALVGRRIAPMDAGEMSGGVLTLRDADERRVTVEQAENAPWDAGVWTGLSDKDAYSRIRNDVMLPYHDARMERDCPAPQVLCEGPLLPARDDTLLGLPPDLGFEFIDLPGLKSVQDRANLSVIQTRIHKAFSLVALDYAQTDETHRKKLLEELTRAVKYLQGRPDSMIFVFNRVDIRGEADEPLASRISLLRKEIREVLELSYEPDVIPFEARLLYHAQCAWGPSADGKPEAPSALRLHHLGNLFKECASTIERHSETDETLDNWIINVKRTVRKGQDVTPDEARRLLRLAREWSGGAELWERLRARIEESFAELVILPTLIEVFDTHKRLIDSLRTVSNTWKDRNREQLEQKRKDIAEVQMRLHREVSETHERFRKRLTSATDGLKTGDQSVRHLLTKELGPGFESLLSTVNEVTGDLTGSLIAPIRDALKDARGVHELEEELAQAVAPSAAKDLAEAYDLFRRRIPMLERKEGTLSDRVRKDDEDGVAKLRETERDARRLYQEMQKSLVRRAAFTLQGQVTAIWDALTSLLDQQADEIRSSLLAELPNLDLEKTIESALRATTNTNLPQLPDDLFLWPSGIDQKQQENEEVVDQQNVEEEYVERTRAAEGVGSGVVAGAVAGATVAGPVGALVGGVLGALVGGGGGAILEVKKTRTVTKDVMGNVVYQSLEIPDEEGMARQWSQGVKEAEALLWEKLKNWMVEALSESSARFSSAIQSVLWLVDRALEDQQRLAASEYAEVVAVWKVIDREVDRAESSRQRLVRAAKSETE